MVNNEVNKTLIEIFESATMDDGQGGKESLFLPDKSDINYEFEDFEDGVLPKSLVDIIDIDPQTGNFVSKDYPDILIGTIYDVFDARDEKIMNMEMMEEVE